MLALVVVVGGCASAPVRVASVASEAEYASYASKGTATLSGQAFRTTRGGDVKHAAGRTVTLDPKTPYAEEWFRRYGSDVDRFAELPGDPRFAAARRTATADAEGKFTFTDLPPGTYYVRSTVTWKAPGVITTQGGVVCDEVSVGVGEHKSLVLNKKVEEL
jgi:hypothetical protein